jgi:uncharacterized DUF497 family protein
MKPALEWDETKAETNLHKHGINFQEAMTVFQDEFSLTFSDYSHSDEERFIDIGYSLKGQILLVVYTERANTIRIIS